MITAGAEEPSHLSAGHAPDACKWSAMIHHYFSGLCRPLRLADGATTEWRWGMNTHDIELPLLPPHPPVAHVGGRHLHADCQFPALYTWARNYALAAIEADRKQRHLKEKAQLEQEWSELKDMQSQYEVYRKRIAELEAARIAYASEFPPNKDGEPDVGSIHENIRKLKADLQRRGEPVAYRLLRKNADGEWVTDGRPWCDGVPDADLVKDSEKSGQYRIEYAFADPQPAERSRGEPVAWLVRDDMLGTWLFRWEKPEQGLWKYVKPLYDTPQPVEPVSGEASMRVGDWLSAALEDPKVCDEMKADIRAWMDAGRPPATPAEPVKVPSDSAIMFEWSQTPNTGDMRVDLVAFARALLARYGQPAEPVKSHLKVSYDDKGDCLYVVCDSNEPADAEEDDMGILYRRAISDGRLVGITIMNFMGPHAKWSDDVQRPAEPVHETARTAGNGAESGMNTGPQGGAHSASSYIVCGCNGDDCRVNGCLSLRRAQSAMAPGGGGMPAEPVKAPSEDGGET